jgi:simple sugar transport system permease protein
MVVPAILAVGAQMVIVSGGIDVSFTAVASLSMYIASSLLLNINYSGSVILAYAMAAVFGCLLGSLNAVLIALFRFPTFVVTLGTSSVFVGLMLGPFAAHESMVPPAMLAHGEAHLFSAYNTQLGIKSDMPVQVFILLGVLVLVFLIMRYTMVGRGIYAVGGDEASARRAGFNVVGVKVFIYCFVGAIAGIAGIARASMMQGCRPIDLLGTELTVIAAVVLGGTRVTGGLGTLTGTMLGVALMTIMANSLILIGVSTYWTSIFTGTIIVVGSGVTALQVNRSQRGLASAQRKR